jgi:glycosyltransferase involved in cell wall biosynthesis
MANALVHAGHHAVVVTATSHQDPGKHVENGVVVYRVCDFDKERLSSMARTVIAISQEEKIDWIEGVDHKGYAAKLISIKDRPPVIIKAHSCNALKVLRESLVLYPWQKVLISLSLLRTFGELRREYYCLTKADMLITPSKRILDECIRQGLALPSRRAIIPNPVGPELRPPYWPPDSQTKIALFVGRLDIGKGIQYLPAVAKALKGSDSRLVIVGQDSYARGLGSLKSWLMSQFEEMFDRVEFYDAVPPDQIAGLIDKASLVIVPSRWDNFPNVVLEAMQRGRPVVASPHGGMPEMIEATGCPVIDPEDIDFGAAVRRLLDNPDDIERLGKNMYQKCMKDYSPSKIADEYVRLVSAKLELTE